MNIVRILSAALLLSLFAMTSCEEESIVVESQVLDAIYPVSESVLRTYHVLDSTFDVSGPIVDEYIKRERVVGTTTDLQGRRVYQIQVERRSLTAGSFETSHRWNLWIPPEAAVNTFVERQEQNIRQLLLAYPIHAVNTWDGNRLNTQETSIFSYLSTDTLISIGGKSYEGCIFVQEGDNQNSAIRQAEAYSIYQPGQGHILRYSRVMVFDGPNREFNPDKSRIYREELLSE